MRSSLFFAALFLLITALALVHVRHKNRVAFQELQTLQSERDQLNVEWGQLLLEQATWSVHHVVEKKASSRLKMMNPSTEQTVIIALEPMKHEENQ